MPTYEFKCPKCGLAFEVMRSFSKADEPAPCPKDGIESERLFSMNANFMVKGGDTTAVPPPISAPADHGHGHSHGPGGHTH